MVSNPSSPISFRRPPRRSRSSYRRQLSPSGSLYLQALEHARYFLTTGEKIWKALTLLQKIGAVVVGLGIATTSILSLVYHQQIFHFMSIYAEKWRAIPMGWIILWIVTFIVSFPPLIGYSSCIGMAGFVYGLPGWFIVASASTMGALTAFLVCRSHFHDFVTRLTAREKRFAALAMVLQHDGFRLLFMIRLCPLPFSLTNGALASVPTVTPLAFFIATAAASPKLFLHVWVGAQMAALGEGETDLKTKIVSYIGIAIGSIAGMATGWWIWTRTQKRAAELADLQAEEDGILDEEEVALVEGEDDDDIYLEDRDELELGDDLVHDYDDTVKESR